MTDRPGVVEKAERPVSTEATIEAILDLAASYLAGRVASRWKPDSPLDLAMRRSGVEIQQRLVQFTLARYDSSTPQHERESRLELRQTLEQFWSGYRRLVLQPLEAHGYNLATLPESTGMSYVLALKHGVMGMVATALMSRAAGWEVVFPSIDEDVKGGKDLFLRSGSATVALQVKCHRGGRFSVLKDRVGSTVRVVVPSEKEFFLDPELGIPHRSKTEDFNRWLTKQVGTIV